MSTFLKTASSFRQGAQTLSGEYFTSSDIFAREREAIHGRLWNCLGRATDLTRAGDFIVREIAGESLIVMRDAVGVLRAFFNVCRHRGTQLCSAPSGRLDTIRCPYHAWTYDIEGRLIGAPHMQDVAGFDRNDYPLHQAACAELSGFVFVNVSRDPGPMEDWFAPMADRLARVGLGTLRGMQRVSYDVRANWKLVFQNYSECLHCPVIHPELSALLPYQSSANDLTEGPFLGGYMEIQPPNASVTMSGQRCGGLIQELVAGEEGPRAFYYSIMPNLLLNIHPDYVNYYVVTPLAADHTRIESEWLFSDVDTTDVAFNPQDAIAFWDTVNRQDWDILERSQLGIRSSRYEPGPYSPRESIPAAWDREYLRLLGRQSR